MPNLHRALLALVGSARACSNVLVTGGASADGNSMVGYNADSAALLGAVSHWPHGRHAAGAVREVYSWDLGIKLGEIPEAPTTYNVIGNANCQGLVIGETTLGGLAEHGEHRRDLRCERDRACEEPASSRDRCLQAVRRSLKPLKQTVPTSAS